jgi:ribonuclease E
MEAAEEISRQLRLRDLAGLIVIDFIDMDEKRNNRAVERRLKECLKNDRARIQVGRISHFGLLEMSRQRIRTSVLESSTEKCPHCGGTGHIRSVSSVALQLLRNIEETLQRGGTHNLIVRTREEVALYVLNHKRAHLRELEERFRIVVTVNADPSMGGQQPFVVERGEQVHSIEQARAIASQPSAIVAAVPYDDGADDIEDTQEVEDDAEALAEESEAERSEGGEQGGRRRRRRRRRGRHQDNRDGERPTHEAEASTAAEEDSFEEDAEDDDERDHAAAEHAPEGGENGEAGDGRRRRRRGRRGGRRGRRGREGEPSLGGVDNGHSEIETELVEAVADFGGPPPAAAYVEPTADIAPVPERRNAQPEPAASAAAQPEPARRRSTVREPAPTGDSVPSLPEATGPSPVNEAQQSPQGDEPSQPRKTGWWSRRVAGTGNG